MKVIFSTLICFLLLSTGVCKAQKVKISHVDLNGTLIEKAIREFIETTKKRNSNFKNSGYIELRATSLNKYASEDEIAATYRIKDNYYRYDNRNSSSIYPLFYSIIDEKLILIAPTLNFPIQLEEKSKRMIDSLVLNTFPEKEHLYLKDSLGNVIFDDKNFVEEIYNLHGGGTIKVYGNNSYKLKMMQN